MAIKLTKLNGVISIATDNDVPRSYFGAGAYGKFYASTSDSATVGTVQDIAFLSSDVVGVPDGNYDVSQDETSGSGTGCYFTIDIVGGVVSLDYIGGGGVGYNVGDTITIYAQVIGGSSGNIIFEVTALDPGGFLIHIGGDDYQVTWNNLTIDGNVPSSFSNAQNLLFTFFNPA
jgi:hypothetical protein